MQLRLSISFIGPQGFCLSQISAVAFVNKAELFALQEKIMGLYADNRICKAPRHQGLPQVGLIELPYPTTMRLGSPLQGVR